MPMTPTDEELLNAFAKSHNQQAFGQIAERYSGLIFHTALRSLSDRTLAEDVAQRVLGVLAKKASQVVRGNSPLPAWLHRTTILEAKSVRRIESRHHRKKEALMRAPADFPDSNDPAWKDALPYLDAAIDALPEADRHVILLHYVNEMTFPEIARRVGKSTAAVQKQSRRALETLQRLLGRRGVTLSLGLLTAGLTAEMAKAGPVLLIPAFSSLGKTTTSAIVVKKSTLAALATTLLLCGIPLARQRATLNRLESETSVASAAVSQERSTRTKRGTTEPSLLAKLARDLKSKDYDIPGYLGAVDYIEGRSDEELIALTREAVASSLPVASQEAVFAKAFDTLALRDPESALNLLMEDNLTGYLAMSNGARNQLVGAVRILSERNGQSALTWFHETLPAIRSIPKHASFSPEAWESEIRTELAYGLLSSHSTASLEVLKPLPENDLKRAFQRFGEAREPFPKEKIAGYMNAARELLPETESSNAARLLVNRQIEVGKGSKPYQTVDDLLASETFTSSESDAIARHAGVQRIHNHHQGMEAGILQYKAWLETRSADRVDHKVGVALGQTILSWSEKEESVYQAMLNRHVLELHDDTIIGLLTTAGHEMKPENVGKLADSLSDRELADQLQQRSAR